MKFISLQFFFFSLLAVACDTASIIETDANKLQAYKSEDQLVAADGQLNCQTSISDKSLTCSLPAAQGLSVEWKKPEIVDGNIAKLDCKTSADNLSIKCLPTNPSPSVSIRFEAMKSIGNKSEVLTRIYSFQN